MTDVAAAAGEAEPSRLEDAILHAVDVRKSYPAPAGPIEVLRGISLELQPGESIVIMGPSGCGKSTLLNILGTLDSPTSGKVYVDGLKISALNEDEISWIRSRRVGFVFQDHHLLPQCSVLENVLMPVLASPPREVGGIVRGVPTSPRPEASETGMSAAAIERASELLKRVGLSERMDHRPAALSGGERQRTAIVRAMINRPAILFCDEPTGNLDRTSAEGLADLFVELMDEFGTALVVVTHSESLARRFGQTFGLDEGRLEPIET